MCVSEQPLLTHEDATAASADEEYWISSRYFHAQSTADSADSDVAADSVIRDTAIASHVC
jgi:hypothetical protein